MIDGRIGGAGEPALTLRADTCVGNSLSTLGHLRKVSALTVTNSNYINIQFVNFKGGTNESYRAAGPTTAPTMGVVTLAAGTTNLQLDNCNIGALDSIKGTPTVALISLGTSLLPNSNITISNNKIHDYFPVDMNKNTTYPSTGVGVQISDYNSNCVISGNSFYKTYAHSATGFTNNSNARSSAIAVVNTSGTGFIVKDNYIGGSAPLCAGNPYTADIRNNTSFNAIYMSVGTGSISAVYGNTIKNLMILAHSAVASTAQCSGIYINGGNVNLGVKEDGTTASANIIGDMTTNASVKFCATNSNGAFSGIIYNSLASGNVKIANNKIGGVTVGFYAGYNTVRTGSFVGINILGTVASTILIDNNQIGNNAIGADTASMSIKNYLSRSNYGININPALPATTVLSITNNKINNMYHAQQTNTQTYNNGIFISTAVLCPVTITGNEIRDMIFTNGRVNDTPANWGGAIYSGGQGTTTISGNTIYNLSGFNAASTNVVGIQLNPTVSAAVMNVYGNNIYNLSSNVTRRVGQYATGCTGILTHATGAFTPTVNIYNNMIRLGSDRAGNDLTNFNTLIGIRDSIITTSAAKANYYNNTIFIGGSNVASTDSIHTFGMNFATVATNAVVREIKNNIFVNNRSNALPEALAKHYAIARGNSTVAQTAFTSNKNNYHVSGTGGVLGRFASNTTALDQIQTATAGDAGSINILPVFASATDLHLSQTTYANSALNIGDAVTINTVVLVTDFDGDSRAGSPTLGADEYTGPGTATPTTNRSDIFVSVTGRQAVVNGTEAGQTISVYNAGGQLVKQLVARGQQTALNLNAGIYIIKANNQVMKVVL